MFTLTPENQSILKARKIGHVLDKLLRKCHVFQSRNDVDFDLNMVNNSIVKFLLVFPVA